MCNIMEELKMEYGKIIELWLSKNDASHKLYEFHVLANKMLNGELKESKRYKLKSLESTLAQIYGCKNVEVIVIDDDDDDETNDNSNEDQDTSSNALPSSPTTESTAQQHDIENEENKTIEPKRPTTQLPPRRKSINVPSISTYSIKHTKLVPASSYAVKRSDGTRKIYFELENVRPAIVTKRDPAFNESKLQEVKDKIYAKFLNSSELKTKSHTDDYPNKKLRRTKTENNLNAEDETMMEESIPIEKSARAIVRGRRSIKRMINEN